MTSLTTPDNIVRWTTSDPASLVAESEAQGDSIQTALLSRQGRFYEWANAAARTAQTGMTANSRGYQIDTDTTYRYSSGGAWQVWEKPWTSWTVTWTGLNVGTTGTTIARYCISDGLVHWRISVTFGGTGITSGNATFNPPVNHTATGLIAEFTPTGDGLANTGATNPFPIIVAAVSASSFRLRYSDDFTAGVAAPVLTGSLPDTWAATDQLALRGTYEPA